MIARYINPLIQFDYWSYDILFINEFDQILNRNATLFYIEPTEELFIDRVNTINTVMGYNYNIIKIETPI
jgi:hypothetical protein